MLGRAALWSHAGGREVRYNALQRPFAAFAASRGRRYSRLPLTRKHAGDREEGRENSKFKMATSTSIKRPVSQTTFQNSVF